MNKLVLLETIKGLQSAPVPACSCAKGLAAGAAQAVDALQELARCLSPAYCKATTTLNNDTSSPDTLAAQCSRPNATPSATPLKAIAATTGPPELQNRHGLVAAHHAVYMRSMLLHSSGKPFGSKPAV